MFLLPYSVCVARDNGYTGKAIRYPDYDELTESERTAINLTYVALTARNRDEIKSWIAKTGMSATLIEPAYRLLDLDRNQDEEPMDREILRLDMNRPHAEVSEALVYPAVMITSVCSMIGLSDGPRRRGPDALAGGANFLKELEALDDPDVWHLIVNGFNYDLEVTWRAVDWIVGRPECDAATAALAFLRLQGEDYVGKRVPELGEPAESPFDAARIVAKICLRSEGAGFARSDLSLRCVGEDDDQRALLARLVEREGERPEPGRIPAPRRLLANVFDGRPPDTPYRVEPDDYVFRLPARKRSRRRWAIFTSPAAPR
jgi:hypothetical protein